ncbi:probable G-protein coupled receptor Mth-like 5 [Tigriopus californicus]|uniref:probable G-protein coupled receptor Mth-like 5 n=1 Tax=Tigriopus californicus TaxID=6832 RepID=UPI0027DA94F2|nr:probable G-protein coupled receptor Mth-like 5 [Tigriopus californicus]
MKRVTAILVFLSVTSIWGEAPSSSVASSNTIQDGELSKAEESEAPLVVSKCCPIGSVLIESALSVRTCKNRSEVSEDTSRRPRWSPVFFDLQTETEVERPASYLLQTGVPKCAIENGETLAPIYHHEHTFDDMMLLINGSLVHQLFHKTSLSPRYVYSPDKYCLEDMIIRHNVSGSISNGTIEDSLIEFGYICVKNEENLQSIVDDFIYPCGLAVSILCLILTFLLYSFLPQLRDLTGKFILAICAFLSTCLALILVEHFGWKDTNVNRFVTVFLKHLSVVAIWLAILCMGHHVWKIVKARTVFTRVTDGTKLFFYTMFLIVSLVVITLVALTCHYFMERGRKLDNQPIGWATFLAFYIPASVLLLVSLYYYRTSQRRIVKQIAYNRGMQHFQVNFDLFTKFLLVIGIWWMFFLLALFEIEALVYISKVFNVIEGPLIFCIAMCRTRVAFLFKRYFCYDWCCFGCCKSEDFLDGGDCKELSIIDTLRNRDESDENCLPSTSLLPSPFPSSNNRELSKSLFNVRHQAGEVPPPADPDMPVGRVKRLLKSNSLTAIANINFGWRKETSV